MHKTEQLLLSLGELIKGTRTLSMDQEELGLRTGIGRNTISAIENGRGANAKLLFSVMEQLELIDDFQALVDDKLSATSNKLVRKSRKEVESLSNDF
ncbi:MAG: transcriptional regulator [Alteromonadaceae bacterium]|uniref:helix-turn-helix domain-containing protein n=1 Tax=uncultured Paraglaciecola sp. TaxID=1765024 RepID=UPI000C61CD22|nr:transcriptional regulator [Alteromonadaceae bacterium]|tara:strand:+ start:32133 stop:32423 length:291 start_codon:yes stop_codon:yes gene_type:complete